MSAGILKRFGASWLGQRRRDLYACLHLEQRTGHVVGAWYEFHHESEDVASVYLDELSMLCFIGTDVMARKPVLWSWRQYWRDLATRMTPLYWFEAASVDDDCFPDELIYDLAACHPKPAIDDGR